MVDGLDGGQDDQELPQGQQGSKQSQDGDEGRLQDGREPTKQQRGGDQGPTKDDADDLEAELFAF